MEISDNLDLYGKRIFQNLLFPEGIIYNRENDNYRTTRINGFFAPIPEIARVLEGHKKRDSVNFNEIPNWVGPPGRVSNFLHEDFVSLESFMKTQKQNRKFGF